MLPVDMHGTRARRVVGNLPVEVTSFVGRRRELAEAKRLLSAGALLTLTGPGGVGKTRLARQVAGALERAFPDGAWFVELASLNDPALVARAVSDVLGVRDGSARPALESLQEYLADRQLLLVLDNCEHLLDACAVLADKLLSTAAGLRILTTSRHALRVGGERVLPVPPLSVPDEGDLTAGTAMRFEATTLFADRAAEVEPDFAITADNTGTVARLCQCLDGIPLAIELAAVRLRALSVQDVLDRLGDRFRLLTGGSRAALPRQQTLRATIDWSYQLCSEQEKTLWARLSVFAGSCDLEAVEAVCADDELAVTDVVDLLAGLVDKSILVSEQLSTPPRYRMLETVRQYGAERLVAAGAQATLRRRHRDYFRTLTERADAEWFSPKQVGWYARLQAERSNVHAALEFCLADPAEAPAAAEMLIRPWTYWLQSGSLSEARHWLDRAIALMREPTAAMAVALAWNAWWALLQGDRDPALEKLEQARAIAERLDDADALARVWLVSGRATLFAGDYERAVVLIRRALAHYEAQGRHEDAWLCVYQLSLVEAYLGSVEGSGDVGEQCLAIAKKHGPPGHLSYGLWVAGLQSWIRGELPRARTLILESLQIKRPYNDLFGAAVCFEVLAWVTAAEGDGERASRLLGCAEMLWRRNRTSLPNLGNIAGARQDCEQRLRSALGHSAFSAAFGDGLAHSVEQAFDYALGNKVESLPAESRVRTGPVLTSRQLEVAKLIADGMSNKDIATRLVISQRTAEAHVEHILTKLDFERRAQIAAWIRAEAEAEAP
jgi:predicted ATPase/DNA-binding CsgD family transcriptional regulator